MPSLSLPTIDPRGGTTLSYTDGAGQLRVIAFDCTIRTVHSGEAEVTEHPVELGADISDGARPRNRRILIEADVTNTPVVTPPGVNSVQSTISAPQPFRDFRRTASISGSGGRDIGTFGVSVNVGAKPFRVEPAVRATFGTYGSLTTQQFPLVFDRVQEVWTALDTIRAEGTPVTVSSKLHTYDQCLIASLSAPEDAMGGITFTIELVEIRTATSEQVSISPPVSIPRAARKVPAGAQPLYELPPAKQTLALSLGDTIGAALGL